MASQLMEKQGYLPKSFAVDTDSAAVIREPVYKRPFDILFSSIGITMVFPLWLLIGLAILVEDGRPVFFLHERMGKNRRIFNVLKFRTMRKNHGSIEKQAQSNDPRITRVGRFLRKTALDELPQLWNVLVGDMSFVGPRAQPSRERVESNGKEIDLDLTTLPGFDLRTKIRPGISGIAQIFAPRRVPHRHKFRYDLIYVRELLSPSSLPREIKLLGLDIYLIFYAVWRTLFGRYEV